MARSGHHAHLYIGGSETLGEFLGVADRADAVEPSVDHQRRAFYVRELAAHDASGAQHLDRATYRIELVGEVRGARGVVANVGAVLGDVKSIVEWLELVAQPER